MRPRRLGTRVWNLKGNHVDPVETVVNNIPEKGDGTTTMDWGNLINLMVASVRIGGTHRAVVYPDEIRREVYNRTGRNIKAGLMSEERNVVTEIIAQSDDPELKVEHVHIALAAIKHNKEDTDYSETTLDFIREMLIMREEQLPKNHTFHETGGREIFDSTDMLYAHSSTPMHRMEQYANG